MFTFCDYRNADDGDDEDAMTNDDFQNCCFSK